MTTLYNADCLEILPTLPPQSVNAVITDLPFNTTACDWDKLIPFDALWGNLKRIITPKGAIVLFGTEPFSSRLRMSNMDWYKYDWVWVKTRVSGFTNAKHKPLNRVEYVHVFSEGTVANGSPNTMPYYPQGLIPYNKVIDGRKICAADKRAGSHKFARGSHQKEYLQEWTNYPTQVLDFASESKPVHPTQKPVPLLEYLIRTYTLKGETVLDMTMGSGTTGVAAVKTGRRFIGIELHKPYYEIACNRIEEAKSGFWSMLE